MSRSWKEVTSEEELPDISVTLKPIFGVPPIVWVPALWAVAASFLLFWVLLLPGLRNYGSVVSFSSSPAGAGVFVDGSRVGSTPTEAFVPAGVRNITLTLPGMDDQTFHVDITGRRVASRFFPRRKQIAGIFTGADPAAITHGVQDFASWSLGSEPGGQFQHPPVARDTARLLWASSSGVDNEHVVTYVSDLLAHAEPWQSAEIIGAALRIANPGGAVQPASIAHTVQLFIQLDNNYPGFHRLLEDLVPPERYGDALESWIAQRTAVLSTELLTLSVELDEGLLPSSAAMNVAGLTFVRVPAGRYAVGYPLRDPLKTGVISTFDRDFWIMRDEFSRLDFARFILQNPEWDPRSGENEYSRSEFYLADWPADWESWIDGPAGEESLQPLRYVPVIAAEAVAQWVEGEIRHSGDPTWANGSVRLPSSAEWEYAAFLDGPAVGAQTGLPRSGPEATGSGPAGALGARHLVGNLWEWTSDWYGKNGEILPPANGAHRVVMGGSFANTDQRHHLRGSQPPSWTTPFLGFRLVLVPGRHDG